MIENRMRKKHGGAEEHFFLRPHLQQTRLKGSARATETLVFSIFVEENLRRQSKFGNRFGQSTITFL